MTLEKLKQCGCINKGRSTNPDKPPTKKEKKFAHLLVYEYKSAAEAYNIAYPTRNGLPRNIHYATKSASVLLHKPNVAKLVKEMEKDMQEKMEQKGLWTREEAIKELKAIIEKNKNEQDRINESYQTQIDMLILKIQNETTPDKKEKLFNQMTELRKKIRNSQINNNAILSAVGELNKMHGYNSQELIVKHNEEFEIDKKLAKLSDEELMNLLYKNDDER